MAKGKPRHNPKKRANLYGSECPYKEYEWENEKETEKWHCEIGLDTSKCNGNRHNCCKREYQEYAIKRKHEIKHGQL